MRPSGVFRWSSHLASPVSLWYQCRMIARTRYYFWYYGFPKPLAEEG
jgi:hypothetical protein